MEGKVRKGKRRKKGKNGIVVDCRVYFVVLVLSVPSSSRTDESKPLLCSFNCTTKSAMKDKSIERVLRRVQKWLTRILNQNVTSVEDYCNTTLIICHAL